jgi:nucleoside-diphosphate-sugar epimerase
VWTDRHSPYNKSNARAAAEAELLALSPDTPTTVLNLSGLWGGARLMKNYVGHVAPTKQALSERVSTMYHKCSCSYPLHLMTIPQGSLHMIHGEDVARAILAVHDDWKTANGQRWVLTDTRVYDWWDLASAWGSKQTKQGDTEKQATDVDGNHAKGPQPKWVRELMGEHNVRALPRAPEVLGRAIDSREFWDTFKLEPVVGRL